MEIVLLGAEQQPNIRAALYTQIVLVKELAGARMPEGLFRHLTFQPELEAWNEGIVKRKTPRTAGNINCSVVTN